MIRHAFGAWPILFFALVACGGQDAGNAMTNVEVPDGPMPAGAPPLPRPPELPKCDLPKLNFRSAEQLNDKDRARYTSNFRVAFDKACTEGLMGGDPLVDQDATVKDTIFVLDAPEANVTSLYLAPPGAPREMLLETPFGDPPRVPSVEDIHEAIYCWTKGATEEEQETSGRCLPD